MLSSASLLRADVLLQEDWSGFRDGEAPADGWMVWSGKPEGSVGTVQVVEQGSAFGGSHAVRLQGQVEGSGAGPAVTKMFASPTAAPIVVKFDFFIPASPGAGVLPTVTLIDSTKKAGLRFNLANPFIRPNHAPVIANQSKQIDGDPITPLNFDVWYHVEIRTLPAKDGGVEKYNVSVTPFDKDPVEVDGLELSSRLDDIGGIQIGWGSANPNGAIYIANLQVEEAR
ncbi:MAG: hypothetical protein BGO12_16335 [Verrucomicrobia bacterium 61-8]|nr:MAG: hypothetical protein BGO12_16335 [Verrucomicrobia bacterium 61-8]